MRFLSAPEGIRQAAPWKRPTGAFLPRGTQSAGHRLFEFLLLLPHKIRTKQKEQHPIRARDGGRAVRLYRLGEEYDLAAIDDRLRENYLLYGPRLYELKHPPRQYTPKRYRPKDTYAGKGILQIFLEVFFGESQMHRLYLY